jgi:riboflavin synthase
MFSGIVQAVGTVAALERRGAGARLTVGGAAGLLRRLKLGDSIAVNGCCLTIVHKRGGIFAADLTAETLAKTALGSYGKGTRVNLEPPLRMGDALSGHIVQGHVEGAGRLRGMEAEAGAGGWWMRVEVPAAIRRRLRQKGSVAIDGISLTVAKLEKDGIGVAIIPFTRRHTNLRWLAPGAAVNLETDHYQR